MKETFSSVPPSGQNNLVESSVAKLDSPKIALYATARPNAVLNECAETVDSSEDMSSGRGNKARTAATPAVRFACVRCAPCIWPVSDIKKDTVNTSSGSGSYRVNIQFERSTNW